MSKIMRVGQRNAGLWGAQTWEFIVQMRCFKATSFSLKRLNDFVFTQKTLV